MIISFQNAHHIKHKLISLDDKRSSLALDILEGTAQCFQLRLQLTFLLLVLGSSLVVFDREGLENGCLESVHLQGQYSHLIEYTVSVARLAGRRALCRRDW